MALAMTYIGSRLNEPGYSWARLERCCCTLECTGMYCCLYWDILLSILGYTAVYTRIHCCCIMGCTCMLGYTAVYTGIQYCCELGYTFMLGYMSMLWYSARLYWDLLLSLLGSTFWSILGVLNVLNPTVIFDVIERQVYRMTKRQVVMLIELFESLIYLFMLLCV